MEISNTRGRRYVIKKYNLKKPLLIEVFNVWMSLEVLDVVLGELFTRLKKIILIPKGELCR